MNLSDELTMLYERWIIETYPEEVHNKDDLLQKSEAGHRYREFVSELLITIADNN